MAETTRGWAGRRLKTLCFALVVLSLLGSSLLQRYLGHVMAGPDEDFYDYFYAGRVVAADPHADLYEGTTERNPQLRTAPKTTLLSEAALKDGFTEMEFYLYPPLLADLLVPLAHVPAHTAAALWRLLNLALILASCVALAKLMRMRLFSSEFVVLVVLGYAYWPFHETISLGQVAIGMMGLCCFAVVAYGRRRPALSAVLLAVATVLKVTPVLVVPLFFVWKDRRWLLAYFATIAALLAGMGLFNGWPNLLLYTHVMGAMGGGVPAIGNKTMGTLLAGLYYGHTFDLNQVHAVLDAPSDMLAKLTKAVSLGLYTVCGYLVWRRRHVEASLERAGTMAALLLATTTFSPVAWRHGYSIAFIPLALLWLVALRAPVSRLRLGLLTAASVTVGSLVFDLLANAGLPQVAKMAFADVWVVSCLLLSLHVLWRGAEEMPASEDAETEVDVNAGWSFAR